MPNRMTISYIILAHKNPDQIKRLVQRLSTPDTYFYIHIDKKSPLAPYESALKDFDNLVLFKQERKEVIWSNITGVKAMLMAIERIIQDNRSGYCIFLSGQDYPLKSNQFIFDFLAQNYGTNFIDSKPIETVWKTYSRRIDNYNFHLNRKGRKVYSVRSIQDSKFFTFQNLKAFIRVLFSRKNIHLWRIFKVRRFPNYLKAHGGNAWWALPMETVQYISQFISENEDYLKYHEFTHVPDEIFFHSIVSSKFKEESVERSLTYVSWEEKGRPLPIHFEISDFEELKALKRYLFARKFEPDSAALDKIDEELLRN